MGINFDASEARVQSVEWLGKGPARVWRNRMKVLAPISSVGSAGTSGSTGTSAGGSAGAVDPWCDPSHVFVGNIDTSAGDSLEMLRYYNEITGGLYIEGADDLSALECPTTVGGGFYIVKSSGLLSLTGLSALETVGDAMRLEDLAVSDLDALASLRSARGIFVHRNRSLTNLSGLRGLAEVAEVSVISSPNLRTLDGLEGVATAPDLFIGDLDSLVDMESLSARTGGTMSLIHNSALTNLEGLRFVSRALLLARVASSGNFAVVSARPTTVGRERERHARPRTDRNAPRAPDREVR
jgi:hypothetical protein